MAVIQQGFPSYAPTGPGDRAQAGHIPSPGDPDVPTDTHPAEGEEPDLPDAEPPPPEGGDEAAR